MTTPTLHGDGVVLRPLVDSDAEAMFVAHGDPAVHHYWSEAAFSSVEETRDYNAATVDMANGLCWAITEGGGEALGRIALFVRREGVAEIGLLLRRAAQGRGLGHKALALVDDFAFSTLGLHRLYADVDADNAASLALFERAGYLREGLLRGHWKTHIGIRDSAILGKLKQD